MRIKNNCTWLCLFQASSSPPFFLNPKYRTSSLVDSVSLYCHHLRQLLVLGGGQFDGVAEGSMPWRRWWGGV